MKPDEARASVGLPPVPGGDTPYMQQQNYSLASLAKRDSMPAAMDIAGSEPNESEEAPQEEETTTADE